MDLLANCTSHAQLNKELSNLPNTITKAYELLLARIDSLPNKDLAYRVFGWIAFAFHPLNVVELQYAFAIESGAMQLNPDNIINEDILISVCAGLVIIDSNKDLKFVCE